MLPMNNWLRCRGLPPAALLQDFLNTLTVWEIEELDAVRSHIRAEVNAVQRNRIAGASSDDLTDQPLLLQKKIRDLDYWRSEPHLPTDHLLDSSVKTGYVSSTAFLGPQQIHRQVRAC